MSGTVSTDAQALAERIVGRMLEQDAFSRWLGVELIALAPTIATVRMTVRDDMLNGFGVCHGGIAFSLADSALAFASNTHGRVTVSIENSLRYPAAIHVGDVLTATAIQESATNRLAFYRADVTTDKGTLVGLFRGTVYRTAREFFPSVDALPNENDGTTRATDAATEDQDG